MDPNELLRQIGGKKRSSRKKGGDKKHGRNKVKCSRYRVEGRREKNKARKKLKYERKMARLHAKKTAQKYNQKD